MSDGELVRQTLAGRAEAYEKLVQRWSRRIAAVCHARVGRHGAVEDLVQEALLRAYRGLATLLNPERFGPWVCGIAVRTCLDWLKARERSLVNFSELGLRGSPEGILARPDGAAAALERQEEWRRVLAEIDGLPFELRQVLLLFYYDNMTYQDIASALGVSVASVNKRLGKAEHYVRTRLERTQR